MSVRKKHLTPINKQLDQLTEMLLNHGASVSRMRDMLLQGPANPTPELERTLSDHGEQLSQIQNTLSRWPAGMDLERIETLLQGVKAALERMGGNVLPSAVQDIHALRAEMAAFRHEVDHYRTLLERLVKWFDRLDATGNYGPAPDPKPKRNYNRRKKVNKADPSEPKTIQNAAPHNDQPEVEP